MGSHGFHLGIFFRWESRRCYAEVHAGFRCCHTEKEKEQKQYEGIVPSLTRPSLVFCLYLYFSYFFKSLLTGNLSLTCSFCSAPYHFEHLSTTHTAYSGYATSPILRSHPFFIFHISFNLTFHTVTFGCQFVIVLILEYKISSLTIKKVVVELDNIIITSD